MKKRPAEEHVGISCFLAYFWSNILKQNNWFPAERTLPRRNLSFVTIVFAITKQVGPNCKARHLVSNLEPINLALKIIRGCETLAKAKQFPQWSL